MNEIINLTATNASLTVSDPATLPLLTSGMQNHVLCHFAFGTAWSDLSKVAVFRAGDKHRSISREYWLDDSTVAIPPEILSASGYRVHVGLYGYSGTPDNIIIPTVECCIGTVFKGSDPSEDAPADETRPLWLQIQQSLGERNDLETKNKESAIAAINELVGKIGDIEGLTTEDRRDLVEAVNEIVLKIGQLSDLHTDDKRSIVDALNEAFHHSAFFVEYGMFSNFSQLVEALESMQSVFCIRYDIRYDGDGVIGIYRVVDYDGEVVTFERPSGVDHLYCIAERDGSDDISWSWQPSNGVKKVNPETQGNVYMTANGTHTGNAKYIGVLFDNSAVENDEDEEALEAHADDPRLKLHGGTRNVDIMATTAEDGKNAVELLGDNKKDNTYLGGLLDPRAGHPHDAANKGYVDSRINAFTVTLAYNAWQTVERETRSEQPTSDTEAEEDTTIYEQTVNVAALRDVGASEEVTIQICPQPAAIAAWNKYGVVCVEAVAGEFETDGRMTFRANARPATNENISVNVTLLR